jgi:hypothetical protein
LAFHSGREANHSPSSAEVKGLGGAIPPIPHTPSWRGAQGEHRDRTVVYPLNFECRLKWNIKGPFYSVVGIPVP